MVGSESHGHGGGAGNQPKPNGFGSAEQNPVTGGYSKAIWVHGEEDDLFDCGDASMFYPEFPSLPDFSCMSSSSSSSSNQVPVKSVACSSSASSGSSSSAASWAVLKSETEEDVERKNINPQNQHDHFDAQAGALSSTASMNVSQSQPPPDQGFNDVNCMDVMENFGYMDLIESNDFFDPSSIFDRETTIDVFPQEQDVQDGSHKLTQHQVVAEERSDFPMQTEENGSDDMAEVFLEWLKMNKDAVSAEDLRKVKIKKATVESAAKRLGGGKEAMKQLLKLILEWVRSNHLQKRRGREAESNQIPYQSQYPEPRYQNLNPTLNYNSVQPEPNPYLNQPQWIPPQGYITDPAAAVMAAQQVNFPSAVGYVGGDNYFTGAPSMASGHPHPAPAEYHMLEPSQTWPPNQFAMASGYNPFPDNNLHSQPLLMQQALPNGYGGQYPYQYVPATDHGDNGLLRLGSSATKEARKKRMARQRRSLSHLRHHGQQNQQQNMDVDSHGMIGGESFSGVDQSNPGNWVYWPASAGGGPNGQGMFTIDSSQAHHAGKQRQPNSSDRRQGWKPEKNLKFLLQKVLKQSDVGSLGRIVLPKKEAETHLPELEARDGMNIAMEDIGTGRVWNMRYRFWPNNKSRMYLLENTGDFVRTNGLQEGDFIVIYSDVKCGKYLLRGVKVRQTGVKPETKRPAKAQKNQNSSSPANIGSSSAPIPIPHAQLVK